MLCGGVDGSVARELRAFATICLSVVISACLTRFTIAWRRRKPECRETCVASANSIQRAAGEEMAGGEKYLLGL